MEPRAQSSCISTLFVLNLHSLASPRWLSKFKIHISYLKCRRKGEQESVRNLCETEQVFLGFGGGCQARGTTTHRKVCTILHAFLSPWPGRRHMLRLKHHVHATWSHKYLFKEALSFLEAAELSRIQLERKFVFCTWKRRSQKKSHELTGFKYSLRPLDNTLGKKNLTNKMREFYFNFICKMFIDRMST